MTNKTGMAVKWSALTELLSKLVSPIVNIVLARLLVPEAFGAVATITMVISFAEIFTDAGFQKYIVQHEFKCQEDLDNSSAVAFWSNLSISIAITVCIIIFRNDIAVWVGSDNLGDGIAIASLSIIMLAFSSIQMARFKRDLDFKSLFTCRIISSFIPFFITIPLAFILKSYWALVIGTLSINLFNAVYLSVKSKWKIKAFYDFKLLKEMFSFAVWTLIETLVIWLTSNVDIFIVGNLLSDYYLGIYKTSMTTISSYMNIIAAAVIPVLFSSLSRNQNDEVEFKKTFLNMQKYTAVILIPMSVGIFVYSDLVTSILLGNQWMEASKFIGLWGLTSGITILVSHFCSEVFRSKGKPRISTFVQISHILCIIPVVYYYARGNIETLFIARSMVRMQLSVVGLAVICLVFKFKMRDIISNLLPPIISASVMGAVGYMLVSMNSALIWQFASIFICIIIYFATLLILFPKTRRELFSIPIVSKVLSKVIKKDR